MSSHNTPLRRLHDDIDYSAQFGGYRYRPAPMMHHHGGGGGGGGGGHMPMQDLYRAEQDLAIRRLEADAEKLQGMYDQVKGETHDRAKELMEERQRNAESERELRQRVMDVERELRTAQDAAHLANSAEMSELQSKLSGMQKDVFSREQDLRSKEHLISTLEAQLADERDRSKSSSEQYEGHTGQLRRDNEDLLGKLGLATRELDVLRAQTERQQEISGMLDEDLKQRKERLSEIEKRNMALQSELSERDSTIHTQTMELDRLKRDTEMTGKRNEELQARVEELEGASLEMKGELVEVKDRYNNIATTLGCTEWQRHRHHAIEKLRGLQGELVSSEREVTECKKNMAALEDRLAIEKSGREEAEAAWRRERESMQEGMSAVRDSLQATIDSLREDITGRGEDISKLRDELLERTREVRDLTMQGESHEREHSLKDDTIRRQNEIIEEREQRIREAEGLDASLGATWRHEKSRLQTDHGRELSELRERLLAEQEEGRSHRYYAECCRRMGQLLDVDVDTAPAIYTKKLVTELEACMTELGELKAANESLDVTNMQLQQSSLYRSLPVAHDFGGGAHHQPHHSYHGHGHAPHQGPHHGLAHTPGHAPWHGHGLGHTHGSTLSGKDEEWLRAELKANEERWIKLRVKHDTFCRAVAKALNVSNPDTEDLLHALKAYIKKHHGKHGKDHKADKGPRKAGRHHDDDHHHQAKSLSKKLKAALETVESQDLWIDLLQKKIEQLDSTGNASLLHEVQTLRDQVARFKTHLGDSDHHTHTLRGSGPVTMLLDKSGGQDMALLKARIIDLESRLAKHNAFRTQLMTLLGINTAVTATDHEITSAIRTLQARADSHKAGRGTDGLRSSHRLHTSGRSPYRHL